MVAEVKKPKKVMWLKKGSWTKASLNHTAARVVKMNSRFLAQHFTIKISIFQLPRKGVKSQLSRSSCMYIVGHRKIILHRQPFSIWTCMSTNMPCRSILITESPRAYLPLYLWLYCTLSFSWADSIVLSECRTWLAHTQRCHSSPYPFHSHQGLFHYGNAFKHRHAH